MIIQEVASLTTVTNFANVAPFVYSTTPGGYIYPDFWVDVFGLPDPSRNYSIIVGSFIRDFIHKYNEVQSLNDCLSSEGSFYWDGTLPNQILYIHFEHSFEGWNAIYQYGTFHGFSDNRVIYLDDQEYAPLIKSSPSVAQSQDIRNYDKLSFMSGNSVIANGAVIENGKRVGVADFVINEKPFGNDVFLYYYPDDKLDQYGNGDRIHLVRLGSFYIENWKTTLTNVTFILQDKRKSGNINIPTEVFTTIDYPDIGDLEGETIPLMYGEVREAKALLTNGELTSGDVDFRVSLILTVIGTVQVEIDKVWTTVATASVNIPTGEFTLSAANGRNSNGGAYNCRVLLPTGIAIAKTSDIIIDINDRYLNIPFVESFYDITEWNSETAALSSGGVVFDKKINLYEAVRIVQSGSIVGFRYEINNENQRTIRIDDPGRAVSGRITPEDIQNRQSMPVSTKSKEVFAGVDVNYSKSYNSGRYRLIQNSDYVQSVLSNYKETETTSVDTILNNEPDAIIRGQGDALRLSTIPEIMVLILKGEQFLPIRIFDTYDVEATPDFADADTQTIIGREYYGFINGKVIGISPNLKLKQNTILLEIKP
jgi:hypothetical protein